VLFRGLATHLIDSREKARYTVLRWILPSRQEHTGACRWLAAWAERKNVEALKLVLQGGEMVAYVTDTSKWEPWQRDYRLGLILIMPPEEVARQIDPLRARHDPKAFAICPTHISVSDPLLREMTPELEGEIRAILAQIEPFTLYYDKPHASTEHAGVAYPITPQAPIDGLKAALHRAAVLKGAAYKRRHIPAHMTIAEFISIEESLRLCSELQDSAPSGSFLCDRLTFIVPDPEFHFQRVDTYYLGTTRPYRLQQRMAKAEGARHLPLFSI
jgi:hypothetical protein